MLWGNGRISLIDIFMANIDGLLCVFPMLNDSEQLCLLIYVMLLVELSALQFPYCYKYTRL